MNIELYGSDRDALLRLDPRTKLIIFATGGLVAFGCTGTLPTLIYASFLCAVLALCGKKWAALKWYIAYIFILLLRYAIFNLANDGTGFAGAISALVGIFICGFPIIISFMILLKTTRVDQLLAALQAMRLPSVIMIPLAVMLRFIPTVVDEWNGIRKAMAFRGISLEPASVIANPMKTVEYILIPLLFSCVAVIDEMSAASLARGMDREARRSSYETVRFGAADYATAALAALIVVYALSIGKESGI